MTLVEALFPKGPLGLAAPEARRAFLSERRFVPGLSLARRESGVTKLRAVEVEASDWLSGTIAKANGCLATTLPDRTREVAIKEHIAHRWSVHPATVCMSDGIERSAAAPLNVQRFNVKEVDGEVTVSANGKGRLALSGLRRFWRKQLGVGAWFGEDFFLALVRQFISIVRVEDPHGLATLSERGCLFLGNHQVGVESLLFSIVSAALLERPTAVIAKAEHRNSWIGQLLTLCFSRPNLHVPELLVLVDREDQKEVLSAIEAHFASVRNGRQNLLIHAEGTRSLQERQPVTVVSSAVIDAAVSMGLPIIPVRFARGLPLQPLKARLEFPIGYGRQELWLGASIPLDQLVPLTSLERRKHVLACLNHLGGQLTREEACVPDTAFAARVQRAQEQRGWHETRAVLSCVLADIAEASEETQRLRAFVDGEATLSGSDAISAWLIRCAQELFGVNSEPES